MNSGKCQYRSSTCSCPIYYDPATLCNQTIFAAYHRLDLIYPAIRFLLYLIMLLCYLFEMVLDTYRKEVHPNLFNQRDHNSLSSFTLGCGRPLDSFFISKDHAVCSSV